VYIEEEAMTSWEWIRGREIVGRYIEVNTKTRMFAILRSGS
jgi:hypothetical protein